MVIYLTRQAYLDFRGPFVCVLCDRRMLAELSSWLLVKRPTIYQFMLIQREHLETPMGSQGHYGYKSSVSVFSTFTAFLNVAAFSLLVCWH